MWIPQQMRCTWCTRQVVVGATALASPQRAAHQALMLTSVTVHSTSQFPTILSRCRRVWRLAHLQLAGLDGGGLLEAARVEQHAAALVAQPLRSRSSTMRAVTASHSEAADSVLELILKPHDTLLVRAAHAAAFRWNAAPGDDSVQ